jgi:LPS export ABC transporter protein LptC
MKKNVIILYSVIIFLICACTFDYGESESGERETPDLIMENVVYVRVRSSDPIAKFQAQRAERYERQGIMRLQNFTFEQFGERGEEVNAFGEAARAAVDIESGDIFMDGGVRIEVESEDIILEAYQIEWLDELRIFSSGVDDEVHVSQQSGTTFTGVGLRANARWRTWEFLGTVGGTFISEDEEAEGAETDRVVEIDRREPVREPIIVEDRDEWTVVDEEDK